MQTYAHFGKRFNQIKNMKKVFLSALIITIVHPLLGQEKTAFFTGEWVTEPSLSGWVFSIKLNMDGTGIIGSGKYVDKKLQLFDNMKEDLENWYIKNDTLTLRAKPVIPGYTSEPRNTIYRYLIIEKKKGQFSAYHFPPVWNEKNLKNSKASTVKVVLKKLE